MIKLKTAPTFYPLGLKEVKQHLNLTVGWTEDDDYLDSLIAVATSQIEQMTCRRFATQTWYYYLNRWPSDNYITLPFGNLATTAIVIKYSETSQTGGVYDQYTFSTDYWNQDTDSDPGRIVLEYQDSWGDSATAAEANPVLSPENPIEIEFVCGTAQTSINVAVKHAMKLMIDDFYNTRGTEIIGQGFTFSKMRTIEALLAPLRIPSTYVGLQGLYK